MTESFVILVSLLALLIALANLGGALYSLGGFISPRQQLEAWSERQRDREERHLRAIQLQAQSEILSQEVMAAGREAFAVLATPSADSWFTLDPPLNIEPELEHWSDIRPSRSGPFALEEPSCE
jgi:hypothetical protein